MFISDGSGERKAYFSLSVLSGDACWLGLLSKGQRRRYNILDSRRISKDISNNVKLSLTMSIFAETHVMQISGILTRLSDIFGSWFACFDRFIHEWKDEFCQQLQASTCSLRSSDRLSYLVLYKSWCPKHRWNEWRYSLYRSSQGRGEGCRRIKVNSIVPLNNGDIPCSLSIKCQKYPLFPWNTCKCSWTFLCFPKPLGGPQLEFNSMRDIQLYVDSIFVIFMNLMKQLSHWMVHSTLIRDLCTIN